MSNAKFKENEKVCIIDDDQNIGEDGIIVGLKPDRLNGHRIYNVRTYKEHEFREDQLVKRGSGVRKRILQRVGWLK